MRIFVRIFARINVRIIVLIFVRIIVLIICETLEGVHKGGTWVAARSFRWRDFFGEIFMEFNYFVGDRRVRFLCEIL